MVSEGMEHSSEATVEMIVAMVEGAAGRGLASGERGPTEAAVRRVLAEKRATGETPTFADLLRATSEDSGLARVHRILIGYADEGIAARILSDEEEGEGHG